MGVSPKWVKSMYDKDAKNHVAATTTEEMIKKRKKILGIHEQPGIIDEELNDNELDVTSASNERDDHDNLEDEYIFPEFRENYPPEDETSSEVIPPPAQESTLIQNSPDSTLIDDSNMDHPFVLPSFLRKMVPKMEVTGNSRGGLGLAQCIAQKYNLNVDELKAFATKKLLGTWWVHFRKWFKFPQKMFIENQTGERKIINIHNQYELFDFFKSDDYKHACNTGDAEVEVFATLIHQPIHLLVYNKTGFPAGTKDEERCEMRTVEPKTKLLEVNKFIQHEDVFLLHDGKDRQFHLLVEKQMVEAEEQTAENTENMQTIDPENREDVRTFIDSLQISLFPGEEENNESIFPPESEPSTSPISTLPRMQPHESLSPVSSSVESQTSSLRRSKRIAKRADSNSLTRLLKPPSASVQRKERNEAEKIAAFERKRKREDEEHKKEMEAFEKRKLIMDKRRKEERKEVEKLKNMANALRKELSAEMIKEIFHDNIEHFKNIEQGTEESWRYKAFKKGGGENDKVLRFNMIGAPFSDEQQDQVWEEVKATWLKEKRMDRFVDVVLLPEVFIRIYQVFFQLSKAEAEKNISNAEGNSFPGDSDSSTDMLS